MRLCYSRIANSATTAVPKDSAQPSSTCPAPCVNPAPRRATATSASTRGREPPRLLPSREAITVEYSEGGVIEVPQHDGTIVRLRKLDSDYDPADPINAITHIAQASAKGDVLTGLLYVSPEVEDLHAHLNSYEMAFNKLEEKDLCPGAGMLEKINAALR